MRFLPTEEQRAFGSALDGLLASADTPGATRAWAAGEHAAGLALWRRLAELGLHGLLVAEESGGLAGEPIDAAIAFERLGFHGVPGPYVESVALAPALLGKTLLGTTLLGTTLLAPTPDHEGVLTGLAEGSTLVSVAAPPMTPLALDADVADVVLTVADGKVARARAGELRRSVDASRRLFTVVPDGPGTEVDAAALRSALDQATLACAAQLVGAGERLLRDTVDYAKARRQFGRAIGEYQALKHDLADVKVGLDFARPLVHGAALAVGAGAVDAGRDVSAAKVAASDAAYRAARTALQVHGAIGYTEEYDLGLWITKVRALVGAWGTPSVHRGRVLDALTGS